MDFRIVLKIVRDCIRWDRVTYPHADVLTVAHDNDRSLLHEGRWYSPLIDTLEDDMRQRGLTCISVARIISRIKGALSYGKAFSPEGAFARALVAKRLKGLLWRRCYPYSHMEENIWGRILDVSGVRRVIAIQPSRELCVACRQRGIWVADIQHGVIGDSHTWYGESFRGDDRVDYLPHAFLCWDHGSKQVIARWAQAKGVETIVTGNRWVARFLEPRLEDTLVSELMETYRACNINPEGKPTILVALSWGAVHIPNGFMVDSLRDVIRQTSDRYYWFVRLHPNQLNGFATHEGPKFRRYFEENLKGHIEWEYATRLPLPLVLSQVDLVISWNSSVSVEAAQMGRPTCLLDPRLQPGGDWQDLYEYYKNLGMIHLIQPTYAAIFEAIEKFGNKKKSAENFQPYNAEYEKLLQFLAKDDTP